MHAKTPNLSKDSINRIFGLLDWIFGCMKIWVMCKLPRVRCRWLVCKKSSHWSGAPLPGTPGRFFRGTCEAKSGGGTALSNWWKKGAGHVCVWESAVQLWSRGHLLIKSSKYIFSRCRLRAEGRVGDWRFRGGFVELPQWEFAPQLLKELCVESWDSFYLVQNGDWKGYFEWVTENLGWCQKKSKVRIECPWSKYNRQLCSQLNTESHCQFPCAVSMSLSAFSRGCEHFLSVEYSSPINKSPRPRIPTPGAWDEWQVSKMYSKYVCRILNLHLGIKMRLVGMTTRGGHRGAGYTTMALGTGS